MATFFLDYEGGSDAADGLSFANRWKTITLGATAARIAPGDTIRVMGSPAPTSLAITATWTNKSPTVTLASALNVLITNCDTAWTAAANVTATADTTTYRTSTGSASLAIAAGFVTGRAAHFTTGTLNLSAYHGITFWIRTNLAIAASTLSIRLCSDTDGVTTVDTLVVPAISQTGQWVPVYVDKGSALGASIASIALYADIDPGTVTVLLDNISTVKAAGADALTLRSLISKNVAGEYWWALRQINGTALTIDTNGASTSAQAARGYYGTTETVTTHKRETIRTDLVAAASTVVAAVQDSGSSGSLITFSGGWNRTDMSTQTLETFFDGQSGFGYGLSSNARNFIAYDNLYMVRYSRGFQMDGTGHNHGKIYAGHCGTGTFFNVPTTLIINEAHAWGCLDGAFDNTNGNDWTITLMKGISCGATTVASGWTVGSATSSGAWNITTLELNNSNFYGLTGGVGLCPSMVKIGTLTVKDNVQAGFFPAGQVNGWEITTLNAIANGAHGVRLGTMRGDLFIGTLNANTNGTYGLDMTPLESGADITIQSLVTSVNTSGAVHFSLLSGICRILKSSLAEASKVVGDSAGYGYGVLSFHNFNAVANDHRNYFIGGGSVTGLGQVFSETTVRKTASGIAWRMSPQTTIYILPAFPLTLSLARIACTASALVTVKVWLRRTNTGLTGTLRCRGGQIGGVAADVTASISAAIDTWQEVTITFTPSEIGVVEIDVFCYGGTTFNLYVDDMTIVQA